MIASCADGISPAPHFIPNPPLPQWPVYMCQVHLIFKLKLVISAADVTSDCERPYIKEDRVEHHGCYLNWHICMDQASSQLELPNSSVSEVMLELLDSSSLRTRTGCSF